MKENYEISNVKSSAKQPILTPELSPELITKVQNGYYDQNDMSDIEEQEIKDESEQNEIEGMQHMTLMGQIDNEQQIDFIDIHKKSESEYKTKFIENLNKFGNDEIEVTEDDNEEDLDRLNDIETLMGYEDDDELLFSINRKNEINYRNGKN